MTSQHYSEPLKRREFPTTPWSELAIDFCGPLSSGHFLLVVVDYYTRFKEFFVLSSITSKNTISHLTRPFALFGTPKSITVDNGRQFVSKEFRKFCAENKIKLFTTPPYWSQANGLVESLLEVGDIVLVKRAVPGNKLASFHDNQKYVLVNKKGGDCVLKAKISGNTIRRHILHLKKFEDNGEDMTETVDEEVNPFDNAEGTSSSASSDLLTQQSPISSQPLIPKLRIRFFRKNREV